MSDIYFITFVRPYWHTDFDSGLLHLPDFEIGLTASVTCQQGMLTHPRHLIPPLVFSGVRGSLISTVELFQLVNVDILILTADFFSIYLTERTYLNSDCSACLNWTHWFSLFIFDIEMGLTVGVAGRQGMHTPPRHLIPPLLCSGACVCLIFRICISYGIYETDHCSLYYLFMPRMSKHSLDWSQPPYVLSQNAVDGITRRQSQYENDSLTKGMKQSIQHLYGQVIICKRKKKSL
jgi:hypothetical protein